MSDTRILVIMNKLMVVSLISVISYAYVQMICFQP